MCQGLGGGVPGEECRDLGVREGWGWRKEGGLVEGGGLGVGASQILSYHKIKKETQEIKCHTIKTPQFQC